MSLGGIKAKFLRGIESSNLIHPIREKTILLEWLNCAYSYETNALA